MTHSEAIRNYTDEELAKLLTALVLETTRRAVKSVTQKILTDLGFLEAVSTASAAVDAICAADSDLAKGLAEAHLNWLKSDANA